MAESSVRIRTATQFLSSIPLHGNTANGGLIPPLPLPSSTATRSNNNALMESNSSFFLHELKGVGTTTTATVADTKASGTTVTHSHSARVLKTATTPSTTTTTTSTATAIDHINDKWRRETAESFLCSISFGDATMMANHRYLHNHHMDDVSEAVDTSTDDKVILDFSPLIMSRAATQPIPSSTTSISGSRSDTASGTREVSSVSAFDIPGDDGSVVHHHHHHHHPHHHHHHHPLSGRSIVVFRTVHAGRRRVNVSHVMHGDSVREWEARMLRLGVVGSRLYTTHAHASYMVIVSSTLPSGHLHAKVRDASPVDMFLEYPPQVERLVGKDGRPQYSFAFILAGADGGDDSDGGGGGGDDDDNNSRKAVTERMNEWDTLDWDMDVKSGRNRVVMNLPGFMESVISFVRAKELRSELNEKFREKFEWINPTLSYSKIRKCKDLLLHITQMVDLELSTLALAYVYFERLIVANVVMKINRKLSAGVCLLLAFKFNEYSSVQSDKGRLKRFFDAVTSVLLVKKSDLLTCEFGCFVKLDFDLHVPMDRIVPQITRIQNALTLESAAQSQPTIIRRSTLKSRKRNHNKRRF